MDSERKKIVTGWIATRFRDNSRGFGQEYRWLIAVFLLALFSDAASTIHFMVRQGPKEEIHPVIREVSKMVGPVMGPILSATSKAVLGITVAVFLRRFAGYIFVTTSIISFWAAWYNIWGYKFYTPIILRWLPW